MYRCTHTFCSSHPVGGRKAEFVEDSHKSGEFQLSQHWCLSGSYICKLVGRTYRLPPPLLTVLCWTPWWAEKWSTTWSPKPIMFIYQVRIVNALQVDLGAPPFVGGTFAASASFCSGNRHYNNQYGPGDKYTAGLGMPCTSAHIKCKDMYLCRRIVKAQGPVSTNSIQPGQLGCKYTKLWRGMGQMVKSAEVKFVHLAVFQL